MKHPDWRHIYGDTAHKPDRDGDLLVVTRETLRLARSALRSENERDAYHNFLAAESEIIGALAAAAPTDTAGHVDAPTLTFRLDVQPAPYGRVAFIHPSLDGGPAMAFERFARDAPKVLVPGKRYALTLTPLD